MNNQQAQVPTPTVGVLTISPSQIPPQVAVHQSPGCCVPVGASGHAASVHKISIAILTTHSIALVVLGFWLLAWASWGALTTVAVVANLAGIVSSTVVICTAPSSPYGLCSVLYAAVGFLDTVIMVAWFVIFDDLRENYVAITVLLAAPDTLGAMSCFVGSWLAFKAAYKGDNSRSSVPEAPRVLVSGTRYVPDPDQAV